MQVSSLEVKSVCVGGGGGRMRLSYYFDEKTPVGVHMIVWKHFIVQGHASVL